MAVLGVGLAAGGGAGGGAGADEVGQGAGGPVVVFAQPVVAGVGGDGVRVASRSSGSAVGSPGWPGGGGCQGWGPRAQPWATAWSWCLHTSCRRSWTWP
ncbi:MAG TPA: hypothetical protein VF060_25055, partial [Trebonia sp.]